MIESRFANRFDHLQHVWGASLPLEAPATSPVILLAGDPGVGKSTLARALAARLHGTAGGTGGCIREMAAAQGRSLDEFNHELGARPEIDVFVDTLAATKIWRGEVSVFDGRLAGHLGDYLRTRGRRPLVTIYLRCAPPQQAIRLLQRDGDATMWQGSISCLLDTPHTSLMSCAQALRSRSHHAASTLIERQANRMASDRARIRAVYGVEIDDPECFDCVIDTTELSVAASVEHALFVMALPGVVTSR